MATLSTHQLKHHNTNTPSHIQTVKLYGPRVDKALLTHLHDGLGVSTVRRFEIESRQVSDADLAILARYGSDLHHLVLHCIKLTDAALATIAASCRNLTLVDLSGCVRVGDEGVIALAQHCTKITDVKLTKCHRITDRALIALAMRCSLTSIQVDQCLKVSGLGLGLLLQSQSALTALSFANCPKVRGAEFQRLSHPPTVQRLEVLSMSGCAALADESVAMLISQNAQSLRELQLAALPELTPATLACIARCPELKTLDLSMCRSLSSADLAVILRGCKQLQTLSLQGCVALDDLALHAIAQHGTQVEKLSLEFCYAITDDGVSKIASHCLKLAELNVKACNQLTTKAFRSLARRSPAAALLRRLDIGACANMETVAAFSAIVSERFPRCRVCWA